MKKVFELNKFQSIEVNVPEGLEYSQENRWFTNLTPFTPLNIDEIEVGQELFLISNCYAGYAPIVHYGAVIKEIIKSEEGDKIVISSTQDDEYFKKGEEREMLLSKGWFANCNEADIEEHFKRCGERLTPEQYDYWFGHINVYASKEAWNEAIIKAYDEKLIEKNKKELVEKLKKDLNSLPFEVIEKISSDVEFYKSLAK